MAMSYTVGGGTYFYTRLMEYLVERKNVKVGIIDFQDALFPEYVHETHPDWNVHHVNIKDFSWELEDNSVIFCPLEWTCLLHKTSAKNVRIATIIWESEIGWRIVFEKRELKKLSGLVKEKDAVCFIDTSLAKFVKKTQLKTDFKETVLPLYAETHTENFIHQQVNPDEINLVWLGRLSPTKIMSLENIIQNFSLYKTDKRKRLHIIGDGNAINPLKEFCRKFPDIEFIFCGVMTGENLKEYLQTKTDIAVAMGTSCINCADLGLPAIWAHEWPYPYFCDQFMWMHEQEGFNLSSSYPVEYRCGKEKCFQDMLDDCFVNGRFSEIAEKCRDYARKNHGNIETVGQKFYDIISATRLNYEDLKRLFKKMPYNQLRVNRLKLFGLTIYKTVRFYDATSFYFMGIKIFKIKRSGDVTRFYFMGIKIFKIKRSGDVIRFYFLFMPLPIKLTRFGGFSFPDITNRSLRYTSNENKGG